MLSYSEAWYRLTDELGSLYDKQEAAAISHEVMEHLTGLSRLDRLIAKGKLLDGTQQALFDDMRNRLLQGEPLQYVTGTGWFMGRPFRVDKNVLIPRPETEELVQWITGEWKNRQDISILDIGTGSGCIPVSLKLGLPGAAVTGLDISGEALEVARTNAEALGATIGLIKQDFLDTAGWPSFPVYDIIVSNPPYIPEKDKEEMHINVKGYEPAMALFVSDDDPMIFCRRIAAFGLIHLNAGGTVYCELHRDLAAEARSIMEPYYKDIAIRKDMSGNDRMMKAVKR